MKNHSNIKRIIMPIALICTLLASSQSPEQAYPHTRGEWTEIQLHGQTVMVEKVGEQYILGGDMVVIPDHLASSGQTRSTGRTRNRWPDNTVFFAIDPNLPDQKRVTDAIAHWEANTCIRFVRRTNQAAFVEFIPSQGCWSSVGRTGGRQLIGLASGCSTGSTIHEIGHAVGLWHEQSRADRDDWITIHWDNIEQNKKHNFQTYEARGYDGDEYTDALDLGSIMMYSPRAFSRNGLPTITLKDGSLYNYQRNGLSAGDRQGITRMYCGCLDNLTIIENVPSGTTSIQRAGNTLTASNTIATNASATYIADSLMVLAPGFRTKEGGFFSGIIEECVSESTSSGMEGSDAQTSVDAIDASATSGGVASQFQLFPNPTQSIVTIDLMGGADRIRSLSLYDLTGRLLYEEELGEGSLQEEIDLSSYPVGIYLIRVQTDQYGPIIQKIVKE